jgi:7,8-dihydropterin-6-yl-methyl-4-(beta-D-ribofuranosyl)aminobenzene 5'-phosphate synthase
MITRLRITLLVDNTVGSTNMLAEHGLSILIEADGWRILFDTGQGRVLRENLSTLGLSLDPLDALVLSHGHYDHTGGVAAVLGASTPKAIFIHPAALEEKFTSSGQSPCRSIGIPAQSRAALDAAQDRIVWTREAAEVVPGVWSTGEIPRENPEEKSEQSFYLDPDGRVIDPLVDDQALFIETNRGLVVAAGCAHAGAVNTLDHVCRLTGRTEVLALIGGLHLGRASRKRLEMTGSALGRRNLQLMAPCHCTGMAAQSYLRARFNSLVRDVGAGYSVVFE